MRPRAADMLLRGAERRATASRCPCMANETEKSTQMDLRKLLTVATIGTMALAAASPLAAAPLLPNHPAPTPATQNATELQQVQYRHCAAVTVIATAITAIALTGIATAMVRVPPPSAASRPARSSGAPSPTAAPRPPTPRPIAPSGSGPTTRAQAPISAMTACAVPARNDTKVDAPRHRPPPGPMARDKTSAATNATKFVSSG